MAKTSDGLKKYGKSKPTVEIAEDLEAHEDIDDPNALAAWVRRQGLGISPKKFAEYGARMKKSGK